MTEEASMEPQTGPTKEGGQEKSHSVSRSSAAEQSANVTARRVGRPAEEPSPLTRRNFVKMGVGAMGAIALLEIGGASLLFLQPRALEGEFGGVVGAGTVDSFPNGTVTEFPSGRFFLIRTEEGGFLAVYRRCTHLGCAVSWEATKDHFVCPCHGSNFDFYGNVESPPAPRALDTFPVQIADGQVLVDTAQPQSRDTFQADQLVYV